MKNLFFLILQATLFFINTTTAQIYNIPSYTVLVDESAACWLNSTGVIPIFTINNKSGYSFFLQFADDTLEVKSNGEIRFPITTIVNNTIVLSNGKKIVMPNNKDAEIRFKWLPTTAPNSKIKDNTQIFECKKQAVGNNSTLSDTFKTTLFYFIPSPEQEAEYLKMAYLSETAYSTTCCPGTKELVFDYPRQCLVPNCDLEDCICKKCNKKAKNACDTCKNEFRCTHRQNSFRWFHPQIGENLRVKVTGMNPYRDKLILHADFYDRNKEDKADFQNMLDRGERPDSTQVKKEKNREALMQNKQTPKEKIEIYIPAFRDEMAKFYADKYIAQSLNTSFIMRCVIHIKSNIEARFDIPVATPELMTEKLNKWLDSISVNDDQYKDKDKYRDLLKEGIVYYQKILNYRTPSAWLLQVKNSDITKLGFEWYRDGQKVSDDPQTFEFFNKGGFTIDYSVGVAVNGLVNHTFTTKATVVFDSITMQDETKYRVIRERTSKINIGPIILAHAYYRYPVLNRFKIGATTGFITSTRDNDFGVNFLFGTSLLFGSEERFILTGGFILGKVSRLGEGLKEGEKEGTLLEPPSAGETTNVTTRDVYDCKWFIGVTYNLGK